jgi:SdpC family antimicrobial peptide
MITFVRKTCGNIYFIAPLLASFILLSCGRDNVFPTSPSDSEVMTGEDIFKAVFFLEGKLADKLPSLKNSVQQRGKLYTDEQMSRKEFIEKNKFIEDMITNIQSVNQSFFKNFKREMQSKDVDRINMALNEASNVYIKAGLLSKTYGKVFKNAMNIAENIDISKYNIHTKEGMEKLKKDIKDSQVSVSTDPETCIALFVVVVVAVAVWEAVAAINAVAVVNVAAAVNLIAYVNAAVAGTRVAEGSMENEMIISEIASNF